MRYAFGRNWQKFLASAFDDERGDIAREQLLSFLRLDTLAGKSFLDIGSGSGIHSLAAARSGAARVVSFDYDADSVAATDAVRRTAALPVAWEVSQGSILDAALPQRLGTFDIVYSWGVLHHTGDQWTALANAARMVAPGGRMFIALYERDFHVAPTPDYWLAAKQRYNRAGAVRRAAMELAYLWSEVLHARPSALLRLPSVVRDYKQYRGMDLMSDVRDWLGGWPMEFSTPAEVVEAAARCGLVPVDIRLGASNTEYLLVRAGDAVDGCPPMTSEEVAAASLPVARSVSEAVAGRREVHVFGIGRGAEIVADALAAAGVGVASFITHDDQAGSLRGRPVVPLPSFLRDGDRDARILLSNTAVVANGSRLLAGGFTNLVNCQPLARHVNLKGRAD